MVAQVLRQPVAVLARKDRPAPTNPNSSRTHRARTRPNRNGFNRQRCRLNLARAHAPEPWLMGQRWPIWAPRPRARARTP